MTSRREVATGAGVLLLSAGVLVAGGVPQPLAFVLLYLGAALLAYAMVRPERMARQKVTDQSLNSPQRRNNIAVLASYGRSLIAIAVALAVLGGLSELIGSSGRSAALLWAAGMLLASGTAAVWVWSRERQEPEPAALAVESTEQRLPTAADVATDAAR